MKIKEFIGLLLVAVLILVFNISLFIGACLIVKYVFF